MSWAVERVWKAVWQDLPAFGCIFLDGLTMRSMASAYVRGSLGRSSSIYSPLTNGLDAVSISFSSSADDDDARDKGICRLRGHLSVKMTFLESEMKQ
jgi:hypothetical protein